jgi:hypothetical protein
VTGAWRAPRDPLAAGPSENATAINPTVCTLVMQILSVLQSTSLARLLLYLRRLNIRVRRLEIDLQHLGTEVDGLARGPVIPGKPKQGGGTQSAKSWPIRVGYGPARPRYLVNTKL